MFEIKTPPNINVEKLLKRGYMLGKLRGQATCVVSEIFIPDGVIVMWVSPKTQDYLIKESITFNPLSEED